MCATKASARPHARPHARCNEKPRIRRREGVGSGRLRGCWPGGPQVHADDRRRLDFIVHGATTNGEAVGDPNGG